MINPSVLPQGIVVPGIFYRAAARYKNFPGLFSGVGDFLALQFPERRFPVRRENLRNALSDAPRYALVNVNGFPPGEQG